MERMPGMERVGSDSRADGQQSRLVASPSQTVGPFFHVGPANTDRFGRMAGAETPGEHIRLRVRVLDGDGLPVDDAMIELWQADANGTYAVPSVRGEDSSPPNPPQPLQPLQSLQPLQPAFSGFGRLSTRDDGWCTFETIRPGRVIDGSAAAQAGHINVCLFARGLLRHLYTRIYFDDDPALATDPLLSLVPAERRATLLARRGSDASTWELVVRLQGEGETVFFDV